MRKQEQGKEDGKLKLGSLSFTKLLTPEQH